MPIISKIHNDLFSRDTFISNDQVAVFKITPTTALTADSQSSETSAITEGTIRSVVDALGAYILQTASDGSSAIVIVDSHNLNADTIDTRLTEVLGESITVAEVTDLYGLS